MPDSSTHVRVDRYLKARYEAVFRKRSYELKGECETVREMMEADMLPGLERREKAEGIE